MFECQDFQTWLRFCSLAVTLVILYPSKTPQMIWEIPHMRSWKDLHIHWRDKQCQHLLPGQYPHIGGLNTPYHVISMPNPKPPMQTLDMFCRKRRTPNGPRKDSGIFTNSCWKCATSHLARRITRSWLLKLEKDHSGWHWQSQVHSSAAQGFSM